ncbi:hypothetical protein [Flavobacterium oreochromis]|uniref:Uncharacterized protein n=1 Tax=Flavobacterium oreochromis TaxID=2906078 RepID=A0ABW8PAT3_9FLAO|nr:hypothetical protein [Flavobacterium oreochromis]QYS86518.1 hypothetical protein JJC03_16845 [Flavobacterium oreochromis]
MKISVNKFLERIKIIDSFTIKLAVHKEVFIKRLDLLVDHNQISFFSDSLCIYTSIDK